MADPIDLTNPLTPEDAALLAELGAAMDEVDPAPAEVVAAARASFTWRTVDAELAALAELSFDSLVDAGGTVVRGGAEPRLLTFRAGDLEIEVEATQAGTTFRLLGQIVPPSAGQVEVRHPDGSRTMPADELGRFSVDNVSAGPVSLVWRPPGGAAVNTEWVTL